MPYWHSESGEVAARIRAVCVTDPRSVAIADGIRAMSYRDLAGALDGAVDKLRSAGVSPGSEQSRTHSSGSTPAGGFGSQIRITRAASTGGRSTRGNPFGAGTHTAAPANSTTAVRGGRPPRPGMFTVSRPRPGNDRA